jgi:hypothetical protein
MAGRLLTGLAVLGGILAVVVVLATAGWAFPVVRQHCVVRGATESAGHIESSWEIVVPIFGASDSDTCVRNSATREVLHSIGLWPLEEPEVQLGLEEKSS